MCAAVPAAQVLLGVVRQVARYCFTRTSCTQAINLLDGSKHHKPNESGEGDAPAPAPTPTWKVTRATSAPSQEGPVGAETERQAQAVRAMCQQLGHCMALLLEDCEEAMRW